MLVCSLLLLNSALTVAVVNEQDLDSPAPPGAGPSRGRIEIYCVAESIDREALIAALQKRGSRFLLHRYPDVLYGQYSSATEEPKGDVFYFDDGCITFWGLTIKQVCSVCIL